jgi:hypothetical protein
MMLGDAAKSARERMNVEILNLLQLELTNNHGEPRRRFVIIGSVPIPSPSVSPYRGESHQKLGGGKKSTWKDLTFAAFSSVARTDLRS